MGDSELVALLRRTGIGGVVDTFLGKNNYSSFKSRYSPHAFPRCPGGGGGEQGRSETKTGILPFYNTASSRSVCMGTQSYQGFVHSQYKLA